MHVCLCTMSNCSPAWLGDGLQQQQTWADASLGSRDILEEDAVHVTLCV